jgi:uncharacterized OB-fold protein
MRTGTVFTETVIHAAPERFAADAPYQIALVALNGGGKEMVRIEGERAAIGRTVREKRRETDFAVFGVAD